MGKIEAERKAMEYIKKESKNSIIVLLSSYNGEKYIVEQLESIRNQKKVNVFCVVRDDGSTDATVELLEKYCENKTNFTYYVGDNVGVVKSFNELISLSVVQQFSYVAFCDQDDFWLDLKLSSAIKNIEVSSSTPILYCSNLIVADERLNKVRLMRKQGVTFNFYSSTAQNIGTGCTEVFNQAAVKMYIRGINSRMEMHDYWMFLICLFLGKVYYDDNAYILYRQHGNNVVGSKKKNILNTINNTIKSKKSNRQEMLEDYLKLYKDKLSESKYNIINTVVNYKKIKNKIKILFSPKYIGYSMPVTLNFKFRVLVNRLY